MSGGGAGRAGRPWSLTVMDSVAAAQAIALVRQCVHPKVAAASAGFSYTAWREWLKKGNDAAAEQLEAAASAAPRALPAGGREARGPDLSGLWRVLRCICHPHADPDLWLAGLSRAYREAVASAEVGLVLKVRAGANDNPELALKLLERRFATRWSKAREGAQVNVNTGPVEALTIIAPEEVDPEG